MKKSLMKEPLRLDCIWYGKKESSLLTDYVQNFNDTFNSMDYVFYLKNSSSFQFSVAFIFWIMCALEQGSVKLNDDFFFTF